MPLCSQKKALPTSTQKNIFRSLKAYLLLLMGFPLFNYVHRDFMDKVLLLYTYAIVDANDNHVTMFNGGFAVLAAIYQML
jgi:hypothetical protein